MTRHSATFAGLYAPSDTARAESRNDVGASPVAALLLLTESPAAIEKIEAAVGAEGASIVVVADTSSEGWHALQAGRFTACVVDAELAGGVGIAFVHAAARRFPAVPFLVCSTNEDPERDAEAVAAGAVAYVPLATTQPRAIERAIRYARAGVANRLATTAALDTVGTGVDEGLWWWDLASGVVWLSPRAANWLQLDGRTHVSAELFTAAFEPNDGLAIGQARRDVMAGRRARMDCVVRVRGPQRRWLRICGALSGAVAQVGGSIVECSNPRAQLEHRPDYFDRLTGLASAPLFFDRLQQACSSDDPDVAIVCFAVAPDGGAFGSTTADAALIESAARLDALTGPSDCVGRTGPRELMMLMRGAASQRMVGMARCGVESLTLPMDSPSGSLRMQVHAGCVAADDAGTDPGILTQAARFAASDAVSAPSRVDWRAVNANTRSSSVRDLESDFRRAVARGEVYLEYQPITKRGDLTIVSYEALARWRHADLGPISPRHFFELAAKTSLLGELGRQLTQQACHAAIEWGTDVEGPQLQINVSCAQLVERGFADAVTSIARDAKLPASRVRLELPDARAALDSPAARRQIRRLAQDGFFIEADASNEIIEVLARDSIAPAFRGLKLTPSSFQADTTGVRTGELIERGHGLGLRMTATGIETRSQLGMAQMLGADALQGYFVGHPRPRDQLASARSAPAICAA